jgi:uncharacterized damage-inducible protein DinB
VLSSTASRTDEVDPRTIPAVTADRPDVPRAGGERELLRAYLDWHRATLAGKCDGLSEAQLRTRSMPPSELSLLGLVRHMAEVERSWFRRVVEGRDVPWLWSAGGGHRAAFDVAGASRAVAFEAWEAEIAHAREVEDAAASLDVIGADEYSMRRVMVHLIQEYARHNGHADLLREGIDGVVGV